jgi:hypothetical protein
MHGMFAGSDSVDGHRIWQNSGNGRIWQNNDSGRFWQGRKLAGKGKSAHDLRPVLELICQ